MYFSHNKYPPYIYTVVYYSKGGKNKKFVLSFCSPKNCPKQLNSAFLCAYMISYKTPSNSNLMKQ